MRGIDQTFTIWETFPSLLDSFSCQSNFQSCAKKRCGSENALSGLATGVKLAGRLLVGQHERLEKKKLNTDTFRL